MWGGKGRQAGLYITEIRPMLKAGWACEAQVGGGHTYRQRGLQTGGWGWDEGRLASTQQQHNNGDGAYDTPDVHVGLGV